MSSKRSFLVDEYPLILLPSLAVIMGLNEAIILQQLHYWLDPRTNKKYFKNRYWIYNSYPQWQKQFPFWSIKTLERTIKSLESAKVIMSAVFNKTATDRTKWYTIHYENLNALIEEKTRFGQFAQIDEDSLSKSIRTNCPNGIDKLSDSHETDCPNGQDNLTDSFSNTETTTKTNQNSLSRTKTASSERERAMKVITSWNKHLDQDVTLTDKRRKEINKILGAYFQNSPEQWTQFLIEHVLQSDFLMGNRTNFRISLDWIFNEENLIKVKEGNYKNNKNKHNATDAFFVSSDSGSTLAEVSVVDDDVRWQKVLGIAMVHFGQDVYTSWLSKLTFVSYEDDLLVIEARTGFVKDWVEPRYGQFLKRVWVQYFGNVKQIRFIQKSV